ncbi:uncharacterized protein LOC112557790 [Pomacea canaliculata]|uniref:uncharacterized protein LOC112557790 n=1 Tax=Pomacea canaliculata TaxID=400727 RepID=UPI000D72B4F4|nr:uncharacterized protein LOC112557790 [Pomacea canaliculata]
MNDVIIKDYHITPDDSWRNITNCRPQCPSNQVWTINRLSCEKSCTNLRPELTCENPAYYPGCECKTGMVKNSRGVCVDISQCNQCIVRLDPADPNSDTQTLEDGETVVLKECVLAVSCKLGNATRILLKQCDRNAVCDDNRCVCMDGFQGDGYTCVSKAETCAEGWKSYGRKCLRKIDTALTWEQASQACCSLMAELARVDSLEEKLSIVSFLQDNAQPTDNFHLAGNTEMVPIGSRMNRLPSSVDKSKYTQLTDEANLLGCYYIDIKGNQGVGNCQQLRPAICEYDNPEIEQVTPTGTPAAPDVEFYIPQQGATVPRVGMWNAKDLCQNAGAGSLPHPRSEAQNTQLLNFLKTRTPQELGQYVRLGLDFSGTGTTFKWLDTAGQNTSSGYTNFATGQPFDPNSRRGVVMEVSTGKWLSWNQLSALTVVCQRNASLLVQDPRFVRLEGRAAMSQEQAKIECAKEGRGLPIIRTQEDFTQLVAALDVKTYWLDAVDMGRGQFRYSDGSSLANSYVVWATNEPDDLGNSKCVALRRDGSTYRFVSLPCAGTTPASVYPACGPKGRTTAYVWSPYLSIIAPAKRTVADILQERQQTLKFSCSKPMAVDCQVQLSSGDYVPLLSVSPASSCKVSDITCRNPAEQNVCSSLRVRFFCPNEEDMCKTLQMDLGRSPCGGGKICVPGSSGCFSCQCPAGTQEDQNGVCRVPCGKCSLWGDPHYTTLANQQFDFQGNCTYFINGVCEDVKDGDIPPGVLRYVIYNKNTKCGAPTNNVACFKKLVVKFFNVPTADGLRDITIYKDRDLAPVLINGQAMQGTMYRLRSATNEELITITRTDSTSISIRAMGGLQINMASASARLEVIPPAALHDKMCGLCGQCGSASIFKLGDKSGRTISIAKIGTKLNPKDALTMGNTWQRYDPAIVDETTCKPVTELAPDCSLVKVQAAQLECSLLKNPLGIFADCFSVVKPDSYYEDCVYDRCRDASDKCSHLQKYTDECTLNNIRVNWRQTANCSLPCEKEMGKEYSFTANCQRECGQLMPMCRQSIPSDGCVCKEGLFYLNGSCVTQRECGCPYRDVTIDMVLHPNEEVFDSRCDTKVRCQAGGQLQVSDYKSLRDPNSICTDDRPPRITCARGFTLVDRNGTDACQRNINECAGEFTMVGDRCLSVPVDSLIWRRAVEACNERNSTLFYVDTVTKFNALVGLMREKNLKKVFISGQVTAGPSGTLSPLLDNTQGSLLKYRNFAVSKFVRDVKTLIAPLNFRSFTPPTFAVALVLDESDQPRLEPVPRFQPLNFVCEERTEEPEDYTWTNYCNSDTNPQIDGNDVERVSALIAMPNCSICPVPTGAQCRRSSSASGSQQGTCGWANKVLYTCENNPNCVDMEVSGLCPPDVDECAEALEDCPTGSSCVNTHGAYLCKCDRDPYRPLMVINECQQRQTCTMEGTQNFIYDLQLQTFTASAAGFLSYDCAMTFASTVCNGAPTRVDVPNIEIEVNNRWLGDHAEQNISVMITAPDGRSSVFQSTPSARARGGILVNSCFRTPTFVENGIVRVYGSTGDTITLADPNNRYSIAIRPGKDGGMASLHLEISGDYLNRMCGLCTLGEASNMVYNLDDQTLSQVSRGSRPCALIRTTTTPVPTTTTTLRTTLVPIVMPTTPPPPPQSTPAPIQTARPTTPAPPPPPTVAPVKPTTQPLPPTEEPARQPTTTTQRPTTQPTTPPTTTTTTTTQRPTTETRTTPTTTTKPPPTTPAPVVYCEFCQKLHDICSGITLHSCQLAACDIGDICGYMAKHADFVDCGFNAVERLNALYLSQCQSQCEAIDMVLKLVPKGEVPTCTNPIPRLSSEDGFVTMQYECACDYDKHRVRRGNRCIPIAECNDCILDNGDARKNGEVWSESTCSNISRCDRGVVVTEPRRCDKDRTNCVNDDGFWQCHCKEPYKGYPDMPGGCVEGTNEGPQTCFHMADGQAACYCNEGFAPTCNGCEDVDECVLGIHNCSARRQYCKNTISSFECVCQTGFQLTIDGRCVDINECYSNPCGGEGAVCVNFVGGYSCQCCAGYDSVGGGVCQRNTERVPILPPDAPCCAPCPPNQPLCINPETGPISGCYEEDGRRKEYSEYRFVFEDLCLRNKTPSALYWTPGPCPATPGPNEEGPPNSEPSNPSSPSNCNRNTACRNIPPPAAQLTGKVCGPDSNPQTFNSYCDMLIALCIRQGGASSFRPPTSVVAKPGECSSTTTPLPETTLQPLNFDNWSKWSPCSFDSEIATCGKGTSFRLRTLIDSNPPRSPLPSELRQEGVCYVRCPDFGDTTPTPSENCPKFSDCKFLDYVCGTYGSRPLATYSSECILNVTACLAGKDPFVKYRTKCPAEDENPRELCETKPDRKPTTSCTARIPSVWLAASAAPPAVIVCVRQAPPTLAANPSKSCRSPSPTYAAMAPPSKMRLTSLLPANVWLITNFKQDSSREVLQKLLLLDSNQENKSVSTLCCSLLLMSNKFLD